MIDYTSIEEVKFEIDYLASEKYEMNSYLEIDTPELDIEIQQLENLLSYLEYKLSIA